MYYTTLPASVTKSAATAESVLVKSRLTSIDTLRGLVMVLMALDHVRDYFSNVHQGLLDPETTTVGIYLTRWITHLCAPTFILLAGISAYLTSKRSTVPKLRRLLITRGLWIVFLEITFVVFAWTFSYDYHQGLYLQVMWAIGVSMIVLAAVIHLKPSIVGAIGMGMIAAHNLLDGMAPADFGSWAPLWTLLHVRGQVPFGWASYPLIPWVGVMMLGYALGTFYDCNVSKRRPLLAKLGISSLIAFVLLRLLNGYGDPHPWCHGETWLKTAMSFFDVEKYPPSLLYLLAFLGIALLLLAALETNRGWAERTSVLQTFGRVPLFFYVIHLYLIHLAAGFTAWCMGWHDAVFTNSYKTLPADWGVSLPWVYSAWLFLLLMMYPLCRWFAAVKQQRNDWWLSYL